MHCKCGDYRFNESYSTFKHNKKSYKMIVDLCKGCGRIVNERIRDPDSVVIVNGEKAKIVYDHYMVSKGDKSPEELIETLSV